MAGDGVVHAAEQIVRALGDKALQHIMTYVAHLERAGDVQRARHWRNMAEVIETRYPSFGHPRSAVGSTMAGAQAENRSAAMRLSS